MHIKLIIEPYHVRLLSDNYVYIFLLYGNKRYFLAKVENDWLVGTYKSFLFRTFFPSN